MKTDAHKRIIHRLECATERLRGAVTVTSMENAQRDIRVALNYLKSPGVQVTVPTYTVETDRQSIQRRFTLATGLSTDDLPDGLPLEDFEDEDGNFDYDGILNW